MSANGRREGDAPTELAFKARKAWRERILPRVVELASKLGRKELAWELDRGHSYVDSVLTESGNYRLKGEELMLCVLLDQEHADGALVREIADVGDHTATPKQPLKPEEELARLHRLLREELGPTGVHLIEEAKKR